MLKMASPVGWRHNCTIAFLYRDKNNYLYGGVQTNTYTIAIIDFTDDYCRSDLGWTRSQGCSDALRGKTLALLSPLTTIMEPKGGGRHD